MDNMIDVRVIYEKRGKIKYISHLDINRCMQRALKRSKLPVWYTQGFNPHLYLTFALPLSLGYESEYEIMDFRLTENIENEQVLNRLNAALPDGLKVIKVNDGGKPVKLIASADYEINLYNKDPKGLLAKMQEFLSSPEIIVQKKTKKGFKDIDIKNEILFSELIVFDDFVRWNISLPAGIKNINPSLYIDEFKKLYPEALVKTDILRKAVRCEDGSLFE